MLRSLVGSEMCIRDRSNTFIGALPKEAGYRLTTINHNNPPEFQRLIVHRLAVPPPPPQGPYHIWSPPGGHPGQRKYLAFTGAILCPTCKTVLGIDPDITFCQCAVCQSNLATRYCQPVQLAQGYDYGKLPNKKHQKKKKKKDKDKDSGSSGLLAAGAVGVVGGVLLADALPDGTFQAVGGVAVASGEFIAEGAVAGGEVAVDGAGYAIDGVEGLWDSGVGDALTDAGHDIGV
eukprot:TRINITY_DN12020_c0_g1_i3.p1 TRINITY_DN12020_c0_g1~~TRINITY_DN12020_c0_g1_i3.p1  ORF type:complete len:233 (-),score=44.16 TRINITY_DN12020_c0_g1_i3:25-723(-)